jgi:hypothetical protein
VHHFDPVLWALCVVAALCAWRVVHVLWRAARTAAVLRGRRRVSYHWTVHEGEKRVMRSLPSGYHVYVQRDRRGRVRYVGRTSNLTERFRAEGGRYQSAPWTSGEAYECTGEHDAAATELALFRLYGGALQNRITPSRARRRGRR